MFFSRVNRNARVFFLISLLTIVHYHSRASNAPDHFRLAPLVVTAAPGESFSPAPFSITRLSGRDFLPAARQRTLADALESTPGVFILNPYNFAQDTRIAIRGFGARADFGIRGIQLFVDGFPLTTPDGQGEVDSLDPGFASTIEVLRGPSAALHGAASGGAILVSTPALQAAPFAATRLTSGSDGFRQLRFQTGGRSGVVGHWLGAMRVTSDGHRAHSRTENNLLQGKLIYEPSKETSWQLHYNLIDFPQQDDPGGLTLAEARADPGQARSRNVQYKAGESVRQQRFGLRFQHRGESIGNLAFNLHTTRRDFANRLPFTSGGQVIYDRRFNGGRLRWQRPWGDFSVGAGVEAARQIDRRRNYDNLEGIRGPLAIDQEEKIDSVGLYLFANYKIRTSQELLFALRRDVVRFEVKDRFLNDGDDSGSRDFKEWSPLLGWTWDISESTQVFANLSTSFETPTATELDNPEGGGFNPDLASQQAQSYELGLRHAGRIFDRPWLMEIALFRFRIEDSLVPYELPTFPGREFFRNAGASRRDGFEGVFRVDLDPDWQLRLDYTWSDFHYTDFRVAGSDYSASRLPGIPEHRGGVTLQYAHPSGFFAEWVTRYTGTYYADDANQTKIADTVLSHLKLAWELDYEGWAIEPFVAVRNLFDRAHFANIRINAFGGRYYEPAPGRIFHGGLRVRRTF